MTEQETLKKYYKGRPYKLIAEQTGMSLRRVERTLSLVPVQQDLQFLTTFMEWEKETIKNNPKPKPPRAEVGGRPKKNG
jgi:hypothetical protein